ncbi:hypothetical protein [Microbacterium aurum]
MLDQHLTTDDMALFTRLRMTAFGEAVIDIANDPTYDQWTFSQKIRHALEQETAARTNLLLTAIRTPRGLKWGPLLLLLAPVYLFAAGICFTLVERGGPGWLAFLGFLFIWNMFKCAWASIITTVLLLRNALRRLIGQSRAPRSGRSTAQAQHDPTTHQAVLAP